MQVEEIERILNNGRFAELLGAEEDVTLEVKSEAYDLNVGAGRYQLAKDVSAFANTHGGYLLVGIAIRREDERQLDVLHSLALIAPGSFDKGRYSGVIKEYVFPTIQGLSIEWRACEGSADGLGIIRVPPQPDDNKPFLICRIVEDGDHLRQFVAGYAERIVAGNEPLSPKRLQELLRKGRDGTSQRLTRIEERLDQLVSGQAGTTPGTPAEARPEFDGELLDARIASILGDLEG